MVAIRPRADASASQRGRRIAVKCQTAGKDDCQREADFRDQAELRLVHHGQQDIVGYRFLERQTRSSPPPATDIQHFPDAVTTARPIHATRRVCVRTIAAHDWRRAQSAGPATTARNIRIPAVIAVTAKCAARTDNQWTVDSRFRTRPLRLPCSLLADLEREVAVGRVGVHRQNMPGDMVRSRPPGAKRNRHLIAADPGFAAIDPLPGGVGHGDGAERSLQFLR